LTSAPALDGVVEPTPIRAPTFGPLLKRLRVRAGLSQNQLARQSGVDPAYVNRLERSTMPTGNQPSRRVVLGLFESLFAAHGARADDRDRLLVAAGLCPEVVLRAGGWDAYRNGIRAALRAVDTFIELGGEEPS
jgi:transcriptional regulator with XRE-family HTH domain